MILNLFDFTSVLTDLQRIHSYRKTVLPKIYHKIVGLIKLKVFDQSAFSRFFQCTSERQYKYIMTESLFTQLMYGIILNKQQ